MAVNNSNDRTDNSATASPAEDRFESPRQPSIKTWSLQAAHDPLSQASRSQAGHNAPPREEPDMDMGCSPDFDHDNSSNAIAIGRQTSNALELGENRVGTFGPKRAHSPVHDTTAANKKPKQGAVILGCDISTPRNGDLSDDGELDLAGRREAYSVRSLGTNPGTASRNGARTGGSMSSEGYVAEHHEDGLDALKILLGTITHSSSTVNDQDWSSHKIIDVVFRYIAIAARMQGIVYVDQTFAAKPHAPLPSVVVERSKPTGLETRSILFPLHFQDHSWALAKLNVATRVIQLYDPMSSSKRFEVAEDNLRSFLSSQESGRWQIESVEEDMDFTQRCTDVRDCGLLIITAAMYHATAKPSSRKVNLDVIRSICQALVGIDFPPHLRPILAATTVAAPPNVALITSRNVALIASWSDAYSVRGHEIRLCGKLKEMRVLVDNVDNVLELAKIMGILSEGAFEFASHMEVLMNGLMIRREVVFLLSELQKPSAVSKDILVSEQRVIEDDLDTLRKVWGGGAREVVSATAARQAGKHMQKLASSLLHVAGELQKISSASTSLGFDRALGCKPACN